MGIDQKSTQKNIAGRKPDAKSVVFSNHAVSTTAKLDGRHSRMQKRYKISNMLGFSCQNIAAKESWEEAGTAASPSDLPSCDGVVVRDATHVHKRGDDPDSIAPGFCRPTSSDEHGIFILLHPANAFRNAFSSCCVGVHRCCPMRRNRFRHSAASLKRLGMKTKTNALL